MVVSSSGLSSTMLDLKNGNVDLNFTCNLSIRSVMCSAVPTILFFRVVTNV